MTKGMIKALENIKKNPNHLFDIRSWNMLKEMKKLGLIKDYIFYGDKNGITPPPNKYRPVYRKAIL